MVTGSPLQEWCSTGGLILISFPTDAEYFILRHILESLTEQRSTLIHSKPLRFNLPPSITPIDATAHALTAREALRRRLGNHEGTAFLENPADMQGFLSQLKKIAKSQPEIQWWLWWSPSDLVAQEVDDMEIVRYMRIIAKDFSGTPFLAFVAKDVHTQRGFALLEYISSVYLEVVRLTDREKIVHLWRVRKHPHLQLEGVEVEL